MHLVFGSIQQQNVCIQSMGVVYKRRPCVMPMPMPMPMLTPTSTPRILHARFVQRAITQGTMAVRREPPAWYTNAPSPRPCLEPLLSKQLVCVETVLTDDKKVWDNVKDAKLKSPDYKGMTAEEAMAVCMYVGWCDVYDCVRCVGRCGG